MKTLFNKFMMAMVAVVMVVGFSAFKAFNLNKSKYDLDTWYFDGSSDSDVTNQNAYSTIDPQTCDLGDDVVCKILAPNNNGLPDLEAHIIPEDSESPTYKDLIEQAMLSKSSNEVVVSFRTL